MSIQENILGDKNLRIPAFEAYCTYYDAIMSLLYGIHFEYLKDLIVFLFEKDDRTDLIGIFINSLPTNDHKLEALESIYRKGFGNQLKEYVKRGVVELNVQCHERATDGIPGIDVRNFLGEMNGIILSNQIATPKT